MNKSLILYFTVASLVTFSVAVAVAALVNTSTGRVMSVTHWLNEDGAAHAVWHKAEHVRAYGTNAAYGHAWGTDFRFGVGVGTNRHDVEIGFRDDGVVVWRPYGKAP